MKRKQLQQTSMEVTVGAFMTMVLLALGFFTIILSRENIFMKNFRYLVIFEDVSGLIKGDKAYMHGVDVGRVRSMKVMPDGQVGVELSLRDELGLREGYSISVLPSSILGGRYVAIDPGPLTGEVVNTSNPLDGNPPADFIGEATKTVRAVRESLVEGGVLEDIKKTMNNLTEISDNLAQGKGTIGRLLKEDDVYDELKEIAANLKDITGRINRGEGSIGKLMNDDAVYTNVVAITANLREVSDRLAAGKGTLGKLLSEDDKLYADLSDAAASIKDIAGTISRGEGTLGKLAKNDEVYNQLDKLLTEVRATVDDLRETSPVTSFTSVMFGAF